MVPNMGHNIISGVANQGPKKNNDAESFMVQWHYLVEMTLSSWHKLKMKSRN